MKLIKVLSFTLALLAVNSIIKFTPVTPQFIYFGFLSLILLLAILKSKYQINLIMLFFVIICLLSIIFNDIPDYFNPFQRFFIFVISLLVLSPLLYRGCFLSFFKLYLFRYTNIFLLLVTFFSFLGKLIGGYSVLDYAGNFAGITIGSMVIGPIASISLLICIWKIYKGFSNSKHKMYFIVLAAISFFSLVLSGSRAALFGAVLGVIFFFLKLYQGSLTKKLKTTTIVLFTLMITAPIWLNFTETLNHKIEYGNEQGGQFSTRSDLWEYRVHEFLESPMIGIGFTNSHYGLIDTTTGNVEPGSSWGVIFAMIGVLGALPFLILTFTYAFKLYTEKRNSLDSALLLGLLLFFISHWLAEGYMLAAGSFLFFYAWLLLGVIQVNKDTKQIIVL